MSVSFMSKEERQAFLDAARAESMIKICRSGCLLLAQLSAGVPLEGLVQAAVRRQASSMGNEEGGDIVDAGSCDGVLLICYAAAYHMVTLGRTPHLTDEIRDRISELTIHAVADYTFAAALGLREYFDISFNV